MKTIAVLDSKSASALDVCALIATLASLAPKGAVVNVRNWNSGDVARASLICRKLSDASEVFDILLNPQA